MEKRILDIEIRDQFGSAHSRRIRNSGKIPVSVIYPDSSSSAGMVTAKDFIQLAQVSKPTDVFSFKSENNKFNGLKVLVKDLQKEPTKGKVLHIDFLALDDKKPVRVKVPVNLSGIPLGVKTQGGILTKAAQFLVLSCLPDKIPSQIEVDVSNLKVGESISASEVKLADGLVLKSNKRETVASVVSSRATRLQEVAEEKVADSESKSDAKSAATSAKVAPAKPVAKK